MEIDLGQEIEFKVKMGDKVWLLREPTLKDVKHFREKSENEDDAFIDFLVKLGMPRDAAESLGILKLKKLAESLISSFNEKK
jgi:hypothetical protein